MLYAIKEPKDRIIIPLDVDNLGRVVELVEELAPHVGCFKVGLELITSVGAPQVVRRIHNMDARVFYDGKFDDIPNTVGAASKAASALGVAIFNVHASAGPDSIKAAIDNKGNSKVLGVTVLTSLDEEQCFSIFGDTPDRKVLQFARMLLKAGADGVICSPQEANFLLSHPELDQLSLVTPGVRPEWAGTQDQKRVMTPFQAIDSGVECIVIGRPIINPPPEVGSSVNAAKLVAEEIIRAM